MRELAAEIRRGARALSRSPGFTLVAAGALAVGLGANITIFGFVNSLLLRPLDAAAPERLIRADSGAGNPALSHVPYADYLEYRDRNQSLSGLALFHPGGIRPLRVDDATEMVHRMPVSGSYFPVLEVTAAMGRAIGPEDDRPQAPRVAVLSDVGWRDHFGADPEVVGRSITLDREHYTVVGVLRPDFRGTAAPIVPRLYVPWSALDARIGRRGQLIGRLRPGVSSGGAQSDLSRIASQLSTEQDRRVEIAVHDASTVHPAFAQGFVTLAALFLGVVGIVLWIACSNIALLLLARSAARSREMAVRLALGAGRVQLLRQLALETLLLTALGLVGAIALAWATTRALTQIYLPVPMPIALTSGVDWRVAGFGIAVSLGAMLVFGLGPAAQALRVDLVSVLNRGGSVFSVRSPARSSLVVAQVAMSTALIVTAALLVRSLQTPQNRGFVADGVLMATLDLSTSEYTGDQSAALYESLRAALRSAPGVGPTSVAATVPLTRNNPLAATEVEVRDRSLRVDTNRVTSGHFATLSIPLLEGRDFSRYDSRTAPSVAIVNEELARRVWPGNDVIGKRLFTTAGSSLEVVGLARDIKYESLDETPRPMLYRPLAQLPARPVTLLVRTNGEIPAKPFPSFAPASSTSTRTWSSSTSTPSRNASDSGCWPIARRRLSRRHSGPSRCCSAPRGRTASWRSSFSSGSARSACASRSGRHQRASPRW